MRRSSKLYKVYKAIRQTTPFQTASSAYRQAKQKPDTRKPFFEKWAQIEKWSEPVKVQGFDVRAMLEYDNDAEMDCYGKWTDHPSDAKRGQIVIDRAHGRDSWSNREYRYFIPEVDVNADRQYYRAKGYSRHDAYTKARRTAFQQFAFAMKVVNQDVSFVGVVVKAYKHGIELGESSCWGIDLDSENVDYVNEIAWDNANEAVREARRTLETLRGKK